MKKLRSAAVVLCAAWLCGAEVQAQEVGARDSQSGSYLGVFAGAGRAHSGSLKQIGTSFIDSGPLTVAAEGHSASKLSIAAGLHAGYQWGGWSMGGGGWHLRPAIEAEWNYLRDTQTGTLVNPTDRISDHRFEVSAPMQLGTLLLNTVWTLDLPLRGIRPYAGFGMGTAVVVASGAHSEQLNPAEPGLNHFNSSPNASNATMAVQIKSGLRIDVGERVALFAEYRLLRLHPANFSFGSTVYADHAPTTSWNLRFASVRYHLGAVGVRFGF